MTLAFDSKPLPLPKAVLAVVLALLATFVIFVFTAELALLAKSVALAFSEPKKDLALLTAPLPTEDTLPATFLTVTLALPAKPLPLPKAVLAVVLALFATFVIFVFTAEPALLAKSVALAFSEPKKDLALLTALLPILTTLPETFVTVTLALPAIPLPLPKAVLAVVLALLAAVLTVVLALSATPAAFAFNPWAYVLALVMAPCPTLERLPAPFLTATFALLAKCFPDSTALRYVFDA